MASSLLPREVLLEHLIEYRLGGGGACEQCHRRPELLAVHLAEHRRGVTPAELGQDPRALRQSGPQNRMGEVGPCLVQAGDRIVLRRRTAAQAGDLGEDEPHPVAAFAAVAQLAHR